MPENTGSNFGQSLLSALPFAGSLFSSYFNQQQSERDAAVARENVDKTNAANKALQDSAFAQNKQMWIENNEYNSPDAQMARLRAAGLNPNLVYGSGAVGNASGSIPTTQAPRSSYDYKSPQVEGSLASGITSFMDVMMKQAQLDNMKAQTDAVQTRTVNDALTGQFLDRSMEDRVARQGYDSWAAYDNHLLKSQLVDSRASQIPLQLDALKNRVRLGQLYNDKIVEDILGKRFENEWMSKGVTRSDNLGVRLIGRHGDEMMNAIQSYLRNRKPSK